MYKFFFAILILTFFSCSKKSECETAPDVSHIPVNINVKRFEQELFQIKDKNELISFLKANKPLAQTFLQASEYPNDTILAEKLLQLVHDKDVRILYNETQQKFSDLEGLKEDYAKAFQFTKYYFPNFKEPEINTMVTGLGNDLFISDSLIVIGLDFFIGDEATYRPLDFPKYILNRYKKEYIVPSSLLLLSSYFNATDPKDNSVLADMIFYGKAYYFTKQVLPCTPDSLIIGYTGEQLEDVENNQGTIWAHFLDNQLIYETNPFVKSKYLDERPKTPEIGNKAPGRIGNYLGWKIVEKFMAENPEITLQQLMQIKDSQMILSKAKFKPKNT